MRTPKGRGRKNGSPLDRELNKEGFNNTSYLLQS